MSCIQSKLKDKLNIELDIEELMKVEEEEDEEDVFDTSVFDVDNTNDVQQTDEMPEPKENVNPTSLEAIAADADGDDKKEEEKKDDSAEEAEKKDEGEEVEKKEEGEEKPPADGETGLLSFFIKLIHCLTLLFIRSREWL